MSEESPSSRRAWIEIALSVSDDDLDRVALLAEGVDRNLEKAPQVVPMSGRPPRGGRG